MEKDRQPPLINKKRIFYDFSGIVYTDNLYVQITTRKKAGGAHHPPTDIYWPYNI